MTQISLFFKYHLQNGIKKQCCKEYVDLVRFIQTFINFQVILHLLPRKTQITLNMLTAKLLQYYQCYECFQTLSHNTLNISHFCTVQHTQLLQLARSQPCFPPLFASVHETVTLTCIKFLYILCYLNYSTLNLPLLLRIPYIHLFDWPAYFLSFQTMCRP